MTSRLQTETENPHAAFTQFRLGKGGSSLCRSRDGREAGPLSEHAFRSRTIRNSYVRMLMQMGRWLEFGRGVEIIRPSSVLQSWVGL